MENTILFSIFLIFLGSSILGTVAMFARQSLMVVYVVLGILIGPSGLEISSDSLIIKEIGEVGIIFLLFLLGLHMDPHNLLRGARQSAMPTLLSSGLFALMGYSVGLLFGFSQIDSGIIGLTMMFSSTIISLKLLPSNILHHGSTGENMITILLIQDVLAILVLLVVKAAGDESSAFEWTTVLHIFLGLASTIVVSYVGERFLIVPLFQRFERNREYLFLLALGWCLSMSELAYTFNLSHEIGAFIGGVTIASTSNVSHYLAECLKSLRDFFLVLFFFSIGAQFDLNLLPNTYHAILVLSILTIIIKPWVFRWLFAGLTSTTHEAWELGVRLGQSSEFSIMVAEIGEHSGILAHEAAFLIKGTAILTFFLSSFWVTRAYRTPVGEIAY